MGIFNKIIDFGIQKLKGIDENPEDAQKNIIDNLKKGMPFQRAIDNSKYDEITIKRWYKEGSKGDSQYINFYKECSDVVGESLIDLDINFIKDRLNNGKKFYNTIKKDNLYHSKDIIVKWFIRGKHKQDLKFNDLYDAAINNNNSYRDLLENDVYSIIKLIDEGESVKEILESDNLLIDEKTLKKWYKESDNSDKLFIKLHENCAKEFKQYSQDIIIEKLNSGNVFDETIETDLHDFNFCKQWYIDGIYMSNENHDFYKKVKNILINNTHYDKADHILSNLKINVSLEDSIGNFDKKNIEDWIRLAEYGFHPFDKFYTPFKKYEIQHNILEDLKKGIKYNEAFLNQKCDIDDIIEWYREKDEFYSFLNDLIEMDIIKYDANLLKKLITFGKNIEDAINDDGLFNSGEDIREWYKNQDNKYDYYRDIVRDFLEESMIKADVNHISKTLQLGSAFKDATNSKFLFLSNEQFKTWYKKHDKCLEEYLKFNQEYGDIVKEESKEIIISSLKENKSFADIDSYHSIEEIQKWYEKGKNNEKEDIEFYNSVSQLLIDNTKFNRSNNFLENLKLDRTFEDNIESIDLEHLNQWVELGKLGFTPFEEFYNKYSIFSTQLDIINSLKEGMDFKEAINKTDYSKENIKKMYDSEMEFHEECSKALLDSTKFYELSDFLNYLEDGISITETLEKLSIAKEDLDSWIYYGREGWSPFSDSLEVILKKLILSILHDGSYINEAFKEYSNFDEFKRFYNEDKDFFDKSSNLLIKNTHYEDSNIFIESLNLEKDLNQNISDNNFNENDVFEWIELGKNDIKPFSDFYDKYLNYLTKNKIINYLKEDVSSNSNHYNILDEDLEFFNECYEKDSKFHKICSSLLERDTQQIVIQLFKDGKTFDEIDKSDSLYHTVDEIKTWYMKGRDGEEKYVNFKEDIDDILIENTQNLIIESLNKGNSFKTSINNNTTVYSENDIKKWYLLGSEGDEKYVKFYQKICPLIEQESKDIILDGLENGKSVDDLLKEDLSYCREDIKKWKVSKDKNIDFYKSYIELTLINNLQRFSFDEIIEKENLKLEDIIEFYNTDVDFYKEISSILIAKTNYGNSDSVLNKINLDSEPLGSLNSLEKEQINVWLNLSKKGLKPFNEFSKKYDEVLNKNNFINLIKNGHTFNKLISSTSFDFNSEDVFEWLNSDETFLKICKELTEEESKSEIISMVSKGVPFDKAIKDIKLHDFNEIIEWYNKGRTKNIKHVDFYKKVTSLIAKNYQRDFIRYMEEGYLFNEVITFSQFSIFKNEIEEWYYLGKTGDESYVDFYKNIDQLKFINGLNDKKSFKDVILEFKLNKEDIKQWYDSEEHFRSSVLNLLKINTDYVNIENKINNASFFVSFILDEEKMEEISYLANEGMEPFKGLYGKYTVFKVQKTIIEELEQGLTFDEIIKKYSNIFSKDEILKWYDDRNSEFHNICSVLLEKETQNNVINLLNQGTSFSIAINSNTQFHSGAEIKNWYYEGILDKNSHYNTFYNECKFHAEKEDMEIVLDSLKQEPNFKKAINADSLIHTASDIENWYEVGKKSDDSYNVFHNKAKKLLERETQDIIIQKLNKGAFIENISFSDLKHDKNEIHNFYEEGKNGNVEYESFYKNLMPIIKEQYLNDILLRIKTRISFNQAIDNYWFRKDIENWYNLGKEGNSDFIEFFRDISKLIFINQLKNQKSFEGAINSDEVEINKEDVKKWYHEDSEFFKEVSSLLILFTNYNDIDKKLNNFKLKDELDISAEELRDIEYLASEDLDPFKNLYLRYNECLTQNAVIDLLEKGISFKEAINNNSEYFTSDEIYSWYNKKTSNFHRICNKLLENETQDLVLDHLQNGLTFNEAINQNNLYHDSFKIKSWFYEGKEDKNYISFYENVKEYVEKEDQQIVIDYYNKELDFKNALNQENLIHKSVEIENWFIEGKNKNSQYTNFYNEISPLLEKETQNTIIFNLKNNLQINEFVDNLYYNEDEIKKWLDEGKKGNKKYIEFYTDSKPFIEEIYQKSVIKKLETGRLLKDIIADDDMLIVSEDIEKWIDLGYKRQKHADFYKECAKLDFLNQLNSKTIKSIFKHEDIAIHEEDIREWYIKEDDFSKVLNKKLRDIIDFDEIKRELEFANFYDNLDIDQENLENFRYLANKNLNPFKKCYEKYMIFITQKNVIDSLKDGLSFEEACEKHSNDFSKNEIYSWYNYGVGEFYEICDEFLKKETYNLVLKNLENGLSFNQAITQDNLMHSSKTIREWYIEGKNSADSQYNAFYIDCKKFIDSYDLNLVLKNLENGLSFNDAISITDLTNSKSTFKEWYMEGKNGNREFAALFFAAKDSLEKTTQELIIESVVFNKFSFEKAIKQDNLYHKEYEIKKWLDEGKRGNEKYLEFYNSIGPIFEKQLRQNILNQLKIGKTFNDIIEQKQFRSYKLEIKEWYNLGKDNDKDYRDFYEIIAKSNFINDLKNNGDIQDAFNFNEEDILHWYNTDKDFFKIVNKYLIEITNYCDSLDVIKSFDYENEVELNQDIEIWIMLGKLGFEPFVNFYYEYFLYNIQLRFISLLKDNNTFDDALNLVQYPNMIINSYFKGMNEKKYLKFYHHASKLVEQESQNIVIDRLRSGLDFDEAISLNGLLHNEEDIRFWFNLGENGKRYEDFYKKCNEFIESNKIN